MMESANALVKTWESIIDKTTHGGVVDILVHDYVRRFCSNVISNILFGSNYKEGNMIFPKYRALLHAIASPTIFPKSEVPAVAAMWVVIFVSRKALENIKVGEMWVLKGVYIWIWMLELHRDPKLWGPDTHKFKPERFAKGVIEACKCPQVYLPFGVGARVCPGQTLAMVEIKILWL
ncbi:hypothetical protein FEM48_Zijuj11G0066700 [Ziziphus jujuba var. spinosa]|uniref:Uncharacterized protein n=1 Tax=Ziziphus jujuba var. spinosa TaxID=714518 RepID=A0A978UHE9_ZIZJJ|nr:hypothetical protein FEM48_Zijuj11G0066700 [Ziziphus jujuba var. spinosa]